MAEPTTAFKKITEVQTRVRKKGNPPINELPGEDETFLVWLEGESKFFFVPIKPAVDRTMELELMALLREAFFHDKPVKLGYRTKGNNRYISAAWVKKG